MTPRCATLHGLVNPRGAATSYHFQYGRTKRYGSHTRSQKAGKGRRGRSVALRLCGLAAHSKYHYRIVAHNANGSTNGGDRTFATSRLPGLLGVL